VDEGVREGEGRRGLLLQPLNSLLVLPLVVRGCVRMVLYILYTVLYKYSIIQSGKTRAGFFRKELEGVRSSDFESIERVESPRSNTCRVRLDRG
jgi:hypothetical protein